MCDIGQTFNEAKREQNENSEVKSIFTSTSKQAHTSFNGASSRELVSHACGLTTFGNNSNTNTSVFNLDDYLLRQSYGTRSGELKGKYFTESQSNSQTNLYDLKNNSSSKSDFYQTRTWSIIEEGNFIPPNIGNRNCGKRTTGWDPNTCSYTNLGDVKCRPATADDGIEETIPKRDEVEGEYSKADVSRNCIIPVEIGRFGKKEMATMVTTLAAANQFFSESVSNDNREEKPLLQDERESLKYKKKRGSISCGSGEKAEKNRIRERILEHSVRYFEKSIAESVKFAKKIPGFVDLPLDDQANLIRESRTESGIVGGLREINTETGLFTSRNGEIFSMEDITLVFEETVLIESMLLCNKISKLNLSLEEEAVLRALIITATDRCELARKDLVEDIHNKLMSCLIHVISEKGEKSVSRRLGKIFDVLMSCRYVTEVDMKQVKKIFMEWPLLSNFKLAEEYFFD